ncbi:unnamed protein product [Paramecium sonneborni]|uniref:Ubiquitin-like protease family profile domain-containing protein n=1 Tax=Paramecium sonneborni TaxID=65129 RepID=A0A8S1PZ83_9CILI|nr:unnamed protein product [Paramecium sonneborni]
MSKQKNKICIIENEFKSNTEMKQFADMQTYFLQADKKELKQINGNSIETTEKAQNVHLSQKNLQNKEIKKYVEGNNLNQTNIPQALIKEFKQMEFKKFKIDFKDQIIDQQNELLIQDNNSLKSIQQKSQQRVQKASQNVKNNDCYQDQRNNQKNSLKSKFAHKEPDNDLLQIKIQEEQTIMQKEELDKRIQMESRNSMKYIQDLKIFNEQLSYYKQQTIQRDSQLKQLIEDLKKQQLENVQMKELKENQIIQHIKVLENKCQKISENNVNLASNWESYVQQINLYLMYIDEELKKKVIELKNYIQIQTNSKSKTVNKKQNFENKQINTKFQENYQKQVEDQIKNLQQKKEKVDQQYQEKEFDFNYMKKLYENEIDNYRKVINKKQNQIQNLNYDYLQNESKLNEELQNATQSEKICREEIQKLEKRKEINQDEIEQISVVCQKKIQEYQDQINKGDKYLNFLKEQKNVIKNQKKDKILKQKTEYHLEMFEIENQLNISQISIGLFQNEISIDEIYDQDKKVMTLQKFNIRYLKDNIWNNTIFQTLQLQDDIQSSGKMQQEDQQSLINSGLQLKNQQINAFSEQLNSEDEKIYFTQTKNIRKTYPRLYIFPTHFIEQFKQYFESNKENCISLILKYLKDYQAIQYQFQMIYKKIAFIINQENQHYYIVTVHLENLLIIIYDSFPQQINKYNQILSCLNYLFSTILKQKTEFDLHISPTFPIQNDINKTSYYACIALEYYSQNQIHKKYKSYEEISAILQNSIKK